MKTCWIGTVLMAASLNLAAQTQPAKPGLIYPAGQPHGVGQLIVDVLPVPQSLKQLTDMSSLIVEGVVEKVMPSRGSGQTWIETDSVINIAQTFKGSTEGSAIAIAQMGGRVGDGGDQQTQYSLVQPGERYMLFLSPDDRKALPSVAGLKRYGVTAAWAGLLFVGADGLIHTDPKYHDPLRKKYEGKSKAEMIDLLKDAMNQKRPPVPPPFPGIIK
jgi:hypothetical protein